MSHVLRLNDGDDGIASEFLSLLAREQINTTPYYKTERNFTANSDLLLCGKGICISAFQIDNRKSNVPNKVSVSDKYCEYTFRLNIKRLPN